MHNFGDSKLKSMEINLKNNFDILQSEFRLDILFIRTSKYIKCDCYNPLHKVGDAMCKKCLGKGYLNTIEKVSTIEHSKTTNEGVVLTGLGVIPADNELFYFRENICPKRGDLIVITRFNSNGEPVSVDSVYEINLPAAIRGDNGRIEFFETTCKLREDKLYQVDKIIRGLDRNAKIRLSKGKRFIWPVQKI